MCFKTDGRLMRGGVSHSVADHSRICFVNAACNCTANCDIVPTPVKRLTRTMLPLFASLLLPAIISGCTPPPVIQPLPNNRVCAVRTTSTSPENPDDFLTISSPAGVIARCQPTVFPKVCVCSTGRRFVLVLTSANEYLNRLEETCFAGGVCPLYNDDVVDVPVVPVDVVLDVPSARPDVANDADASALDADAQNDLDVIPVDGSDGSVMDSDSATDASAMDAG